MKTFLAALIGLALTGWLAGHVLRYSLPVLWRPSLPEMEPQTKTGFEYAGIARMALLPGNPRVGVSTGEGQVRVSTIKAPVFPPERCAGTTYYTSLPAKCRSLDGRLIQVGGIESDFIVIPPGK